MRIVLRKSYFHPTVTFRPKTFLLWATALPFESASIISPRKSFSNTLLWDLLLLLRQMYGFVQIKKFKKNKKEKTFTNQNYFLKGRENVCHDHSFWNWKSKIFLHARTHTLTWTVSSSQAVGGISLSQQAGCNQPCRRAFYHSECEFILKVR